MDLLTYCTRGHVSHVYRVSAFSPLFSNIQKRLVRNSIKKVIKLLIYMTVLSKYLNHNQYIKYNLSIELLNNFCLKIFLSEIEIDLSPSSDEKAIQLGTRNLKKIEKKTTETILTVRRSPTNSCAHAPATWSTLQKTIVLFRLDSAVFVSFSLSLSFHAAIPVTFGTRIIRESLNQCTSLLLRDHKIKCARTSRLQITVKPTYELAYEIYWE